MFPRRPKVYIGMLIVILFSGCAGSGPTTSIFSYPRLAPDQKNPPQNSIRLDAAEIPPIHQQVAAIDLPTVVQAAYTENIDIQLARLEVGASEGRLRSAIGRVFPQLAPMGIFTLADGIGRNTPGRIIGVSFRSFQALLAVDWVLNPGQVYYEIIAARKRLAANRQQERSVLIKTLLDAILQYYDLVLAQSRVAAVQQTLKEAEELLQINTLRLNTGTAIPADKLLAQSRLAQRKQELALAMNAFYKASVLLATTLRLDPTVTLVPKVQEFSLITLVRDDLSLDELSGLAIQFRPDLENIRLLVEAVGAERKGAMWGGLGPQFQTAYEIGGIGGHVRDPDQSFSFGRQQRFEVRSSIKLGLATLGNLQTAKAVEQQTMLQVKRVLDKVKGQVVTALQDSKTNFQVIAMAKQQMESAREALRLTKVSFEVGTITILEVLAAESSLANARLQFAQAVVGYNQSQVDLLAALGLLDKEFTNSS